MIGSKAAKIMMTKNNISSKGYWSRRYINADTGWDIGEVSRPLKEFIDNLKDNTLKILIPGAGNAYEAEYLLKKGYKNVFVADIASEPLLNLKNRCPDFPKNQLLHRNFFEIEDQYDVILEQTFFCALPVEKRHDYAKKAQQLLKRSGIIAGVLFNFELTEKGPPFGGSKEEYLTYFKPYFNIDILEICRNSIEPRQGTELFFQFYRKL